MCCSPVAIVLVNILLTLPIPSLFHPYVFVMSVPSDFDKHLSEMSRSILACLIIGVPPNKG